MSRLPVAVSCLGDALRLYAPGMQAAAVRQPERVYAARLRPTLSALAERLGPEGAAAWVAAQLAQVFVDTSSRTADAAEAIESFSRTFAAEAAPYSLPELLLFFGRYRAGRYDSGYAAFDTRRIGLAFHREFLPERRLELARACRAAEQAEIEARRFTPPEGHTSLSWYRLLKARAAAGDASAEAALRPPGDRRNGK